jgi:hypothetical protein
MQVEQVASVRPVATQADGAQGGCSGAAIGFTTRISFAVPVPEVTHLFRSLGSANGMEAIMYVERLKECACNGLQTCVDALDEVGAPFAPCPVFPKRVRQLERE